MTETDTFKNGIGITTLASERGSIDSIQEDSPIAISGVALPENVVLQGGQGVEHFYSPEMAERAARVLSEQVDDDGTIVHLVKNFHDTEGAAPADDIIGEVTNAGYQKGIGVVFEAETTDLDTARKIDLGYLEVSPSVARALGGFDETMQARSVSEVAGFRDIAVVGTGQEGVEVTVGSNPAIEALSRNISFDTETYSVSEPDFQGYDESSWDAPTLEGTFGGDMEAARNSATWIENDGENFTDLSLFVLNGDGELNVNALDSAWRLASQTDGPTESDVDRLRAMYEDMAEEANDAGAITDGEFDSVWQDRIADTDTQNDTMSLDDAKEKLAEEYGIDTDTLDERLSSSESEGGENENTDKNVITLVEAE